MSDTKTFYFPDQGNSCANMMSMLANNGGFNGNNGWWIILLFLLWGRNGWGNDNGVSVPQMLSNREGCICTRRHCRCHHQGDWC